MAALPDSRIVELLEPFCGEVFDRNELSAKLSVYLDLLLRWNARTNLTAIREPEEIVRRHFGESLFAATLMKERFAAGANILDLGSGAGFPGLPIQLCLPELRVTLAESQGKKAAFLREVVRALALETEVWAARAELLPADRQFDAVTLRAVDRMDVALGAATHRVKEGGLLVVLAGDEVSWPQEWSSSKREPTPLSAARYVYFAERSVIDNAQP